MLAMGVCACAIDVLSVGDETFFSKFFCSIVVSIFLCFLFDYTYLPVLTYAVHGDRVACRATV